MSKPTWERIEEPVTCKAVLTPGELVRCLRAGGYPVTDDVLISVVSLGSQSNEYIYMRTTRNDTRVELEWPEETDQ